MLEIDGSTVYRPDDNYVESWRALVDLKAAGTVRSIGPRLLTVLCYMFFNNSSCGSAQA